MRRFRSASGVPGKDGEEVSMTDGTRLDTERLVRRIAAALTDAISDLEERLANDPAAYLDLVEIANEADLQTEELLASAVATARSAGHSWEAIGNRLGISRQAAQQRFGGAKPDTGSGDEQVRVVSGLTAFNEMKALERLGKHGWHSIGYGMFHHVVRKSDRQWEHVRLLASQDTAQTMMSEGWERIGKGWFPWVYLKRPLDQPALEGDPGY